MALLKRAKDRLVELCFCFCALSIPIQDGVPGTNAVRMYSIAPRSGSAAGGTQITVLGKHYSHYAGNKIQCRFQFETGVETRDEMVDAMLM